MFTTHADSNTAVAATVKTTTSTGWTAKMGNPSYIDPSLLDEPATKKLKSSHGPSSLDQQPDSAIASSPIAMPAVTVSDKGSIEERLLAASSKSKDVTKPTDPSAHTHQSHVPAARGTQNKCKLGSTGCTRGSLRSHMPPLHLCPKSTTYKSRPGMDPAPISSTSARTPLDHTEANLMFSKYIDERETWLQSELLFTNIQPDQEKRFGNLDPNDPILNVRYKDPERDDRWSDRYVDPVERLENQILRIKRSYDVLPELRIIPKQVLNQLISRLRAAGVYRCEQNWEVSLGILPREAHDAYRVGTATSPRNSMLLTRYFSMT